MNKRQQIDRIERLETGIEGLDAKADGALPKGRTTLVSGIAGSSKTVFSVQFLAEGIALFAEPGVFVTLEESPADIRRSMLGFDWEIDRWEADGKWLFVDGSPQLGEETVIAGRYNLGALLARIEYAVRRFNAKRVVMDSLAAIFSQFIDTGVVRSELFRIATAPKSLGVTAVMTAERTVEYGDMARYGSEEFVADYVIILRNVLESDSDAGRSKHSSSAAHRTNKRNSRSRSCPAKRSS